MSQFFSAFGLDWRLLAINLLNFGLLLWLLRRYAYGPLTKMLADRRSLIQTGVANAAAAEAQLKEVTDARGVMLAEAGKEADSILSNARQGAAEKERALVAQGEEAAAALLVQAKKQAEEVKAQALQESKEEVAKLIVLGMQKVIKQ